MINIDLDITKLSAYLKKLQRTIEKNLIPALTTQIRQVRLQRFSDQVDVFGAPLEQLAESTIARKGHDLILWDTGQMIPDITATITDGEGFVGFNDQESMMKMVYAILGSANRPERNLWMMTADDIFPPDERETINQTVLTLLGAISV